MDDRHVTMGKDMQTLGQERDATEEYLAVTDISVREAHLDGVLYAEASRTQR